MKNVRSPQSVVRGRCLSLTTDNGLRTMDHRLRKKSRVVGKRRGIVAGIWGAAGDPTTQGVFREVPELGNRLCEGPSLFSAGPIACCIRRDE
jgi:hypothetical protein